MREIPPVLDGSKLLDGSYGVPLTFVQQGARLMRPVIALAKGEEWRETRIALIGGAALLGLVSAGNAAMGDPGVPKLLGPEPASNLTGHETTPLPDFSKAPQHKAKVHHRLPKSHS